MRHALLVIVSLLFSSQLALAQFVRLGSCVTSIAGPNGAAQLYER